MPGTTNVKTIPEDDTGVFHILEHSVLGGSAKYAAKDPFAELMKSSVNTFLNAMTFGDKTIYPVASRNEKDFFNLMDVYLDAVFNPLVLENEKIFRQEGWSYVFDEEGNPSYQGVVFNEMKGTASTLERKAYLETLRLLFPDSCYRFDSGGDPAHILDLTYEDFKKAHARFYHPSQALIFLDGRIPLAKVLEQLDRGYLQHYEKQTGDDGFVMQKPRGGLVRHDYEISADENPENKCRLTLARIFSSWEDVEKQLAGQILCDLLAGSNEAPLKKAILDRGLAEDFSLSVSGGMAQPWLSMEAHNTSEEHFADIKDCIRSKLLELAKEGLNKDDLLASLNQLNYQELDPMEPRGVLLAIASLSGWLYGGDPALYLDLGSVFDSLRDKLSGSYFEELLLDLLPDEEYFAEVQSFPSVSYGRERDAREAGRLQAESGAWTAEDKQELRQKAADLIKWQMTEDTAEVLASLPLLSLDDLAEEPAYIATELSDTGGVAVLSHPSPAEGIVYSRLYFDISDRPMEELAGLQFMSFLLGKLATQKRSAESLLREIKTHIGQLAFQLMPLEDPGHPERSRLYFTAGCSMVESEAGKTMELIHEILTRTSFDDKDAIYAQLRQNREFLRQMIGQMPHYYGNFRVRGHYTSNDAAKEALEGLSFIQWIRDFLSDFDGKWESWKALAEDFRDTAFDRNRLTLSVTGRLSEDELSGLAASFPEISDKPAGYATFSVKYPKNEGVVIPNAVSFASMGSDMGPFAGSFSGYWMALDQVLSMDYLWNKIRIQGGAYGTGCLTEKSGVSSFYSFMDPSPEKSLDIFRKSADFVRSFCEGKDDLARHLMGKIAELDPDLSFKGQADQADQWYFTGYTSEKHLTLRQELMQAKAYNLLPLAEILDKALGAAAVLVAGPPEALSRIPGLSLIDID